MSSALASSLATTTTSECWCLFRDCCVAPLLFPPPPLSFAHRPLHLPPRGNVSAQIAYSQLSPRWTFPDYYYKKTFSWTAGQKTVSADVLFIDTVLLAGNSDDLVEEFGELEGPADQKLAETQWAWIEENLKASTADYLFVAGHYPIWSGCSHGPTPLLVSVLKPMMLKYNATGYLSGHDHCLEHIDDGKGGGVGVRPEEKKRGRKKMAAF